MQNAVRPNPVAAMLAATSLSGARTLHRSLVRPVCGSDCSQKNWKLAFSTCSRKSSSSAEIAAAGGFCPNTAAPAADAIRPFSTRRRDNIDATLKLHEHAHGRIGVEHNWMRTMGTRRKILIGAAGVATAGVLAALAIRTASREQLKVLTGVVLRDDAEV